jgi:Ser/Thr protein kinase RdoA (MazF antagonist)
MTAHPIVPEDVLRSAVPQFFALGDWVGMQRNGLSINAPACLFETTTGIWFAKLESLTDRTAEALDHEHQIVGHLAAAGFPTPDLVMTDEGDTWLAVGDQALVISALAKGEDRYGRAPVFAPYASKQEAREAGGCLGWLHTGAPIMPRAAARPWRGMTAQAAFLYDESVDATLVRWSLEQPALAERLAQPAVRDRFKRYMTNDVGLIRELQDRWPIGVIHGDFIKRNLFWEGHAITSVIDFGLWNVGPWLLDLALAMIPCGFDWPELLAGRGEVRGEHLVAMLDGYASSRPMSDWERASILMMIPLARIEFYLGIVAQAEEAGDRAKAQQFWDLLHGTMDWFGSNYWHKPFL